MHSRRSLWLFMLPSAILISLILLYPVSYGFYLSFFHYQLDGGAKTFVGFGNYAELLSEPRFWSSVTRTLAIVATAVAFEFFIGLAVAYGLYRLTFGAKTLNVLIFIPQIITPVVTALFLRWVFMSRWGLIEGVLAGFGIFSPDWLGDPFWARVTIIMADAWQFAPFMILVLYAGLNTVDESQIEAARIDGAGPVRILFSVMLPAIAPLIIFVLSIRAMDAFRSFDTIYVLTGGGPGTATETITMYTYALAFRLLNIGKASALGILTLLILCGVVTIIGSAVRWRMRGTW